MLRTTLPHCASLSSLSRACTVLTVSLLNSVEALIAAHSEPLRLYEALSLLLYSFTKGTPSKAVSGLFVTHLWPQLSLQDQEQEQEGDSVKAAIRDALLDAIWQLDQSLDSDFTQLLPKQAGPSDQDMQIDPLTPTQIRDALAQTVKQLVVRPLASARLGQII